MEGIRGLNICVFIIWKLVNRYAVHIDWLVFVWWKHFLNQYFLKRLMQKKSFKSRSKPVNERRQLAIAAVYS